MALAHAGRAKGSLPRLRRGDPRGMKRGGACSGHRLGRVPPGDTLSGFCAALRPLPTCGGQPLRELRWTRANELRPSCDAWAALSRGLFSQHDPHLEPPKRHNHSDEESMPELSYVHGASDVPLLGEPIFQNLRRTAARFGDREALVAAHQNYRSTYSELVAQCEVVARGLMARGVKPGDRVGIWSPNRFEWVVVQYATAAMGAILVNINPAYRTSELEYALNQ